MTRDLSLPGSAGVGSSAEASLGANEAFAAAWRAAIVPVDAAAAAAARERIDRLTKPVGSLGRIEALAVRLAAIERGIPQTNYECRAIFVGAADHGVAGSGVSAYPPEVTAQMVGGFLAGTAAIGAFARAVRAELFVADFGVLVASEPHDRLIEARCGPGTANLAHGPALPIERVRETLARGAGAFETVRRRTGCEIVALGEMGIGNTTSAAALIAGFTGRDPGAIVGRGTGIDDGRLAQKTEIVRGALARRTRGTWDELASEAGGFEILGLAGAILAAAKARLPIVLDGFIVAAAALLAVAIVPDARGYLIAAHRSREAGHGIALEALGLQPLLDLDLALGEASGAALALPLVEAASRMIREMRTFEEAGVSDRPA